MTRWRSGGITVAKILRASPFNEGFLSIGTTFSKIHLDVTVSLNEFVRAVTVMYLHKNP
jgi:hypothetical protein